MGCAGSKAAAGQAPGAPRPVVTRAGAPTAQASAAAVAAAAAAAASPPPRVKLVLLGDSGVGKSCLALRYVKGQFDPSSKITVGAAFMSHHVSLPDGKTIKFEIWDTAGQERYLSLAPLYYRGAHAAAIVFDLTSPASLDKARYWAGELRRNASASTVLILVGNKADLAEQRAVDEEVARSWADSERMLYVETSAKTAANVAEMFEAVAARLVGGGGTQAAAAVPLSSNAAVAGAS